jgi:copper chaperone CopZ
MKTLKIFIVLLLSTTGFANAQFTKAELQVSGLTCSMCSKATEKSLSTLNFISGIKADLNRNVFVITFRNDVPVNLELLNKKVQSAGFSINNLKATFNFDHTRLTNGVFTYSGDTYQVVNAENKTISGEVPLTVVDKGFAPPSVYKKFNQQAGADAVNVKTGRVYHLAI